MASAVISLILTRLDEVLAQEISLLTQVKPQFESLQSELRFINASLMAFDSNRGKFPPLAEELVQQLRQAAFKAEDIIDDFFLMINQKKRGGFRGSLMSFFVCVGETSARHDLGTRIEDARKRIREIFDQMKIHEIKIRPVDESPSTSSVMRGTSELQKASLSKGLAVVGFAEVERSMMEQLLNGKGKLAVISVLGMGGMGKTTIAKKIYSSNKVNHHFKHRAWVTVSQTFTATEVLRSILRCISEEDARSLTVRELAETLERRLGNERYLFGEEMACSAAAFPALRMFSLTGMCCLLRLQLPRGAMVSLVSFTIEECFSLESLPEGMQDMRRLKELRLYRMPAPFLEKVTVNGADWYKIQHIPSVQVV